MSFRRDFFVSFTGADTEIATALNDALRAAGFSTWFHPRDKPKGAGIADWMEVALDASNQMIAICSNAYFDREKGYSRAERQSMFWEDPTNNQPLLILVKVEHCKVPRLIAQNEYISVVGLQAPDAAAKLVAELQGEQARLARIEAEARAADRRPPEVFNVPGGPSPLFTGRDTEMARLHERLRSNTATAITAVSGAGGIGKSTLAREYAHRHGLATRYGGVWWIAAESETGILAAYEALADHPATDIAKGDDQVKTAQAARDWLARRPSSHPWLVIFDNAPDDESVAEWLPGGTAKVLITSRYEHFDAVAEPMPLDYWDDDTTVGYLQARAGRGTDAEARALAARLGGLPLAAEQAGAYLRERPDMSLSAYSARLLDLLKRRPKRLPGGYPDSVFATVEAAVDAVGEREEGEAAAAILSLCAYLAHDGTELALLTSCAANTELFPDPIRVALSDELRRSEALRTLTAYSLLRLGEDGAFGTMLVPHRLTAEIVRAGRPETADSSWQDLAVETVWRFTPREDATNPANWPILARIAPHARALSDLTPVSEQARASLAHLLHECGIYLAARGESEGAILLLRRCVDMERQRKGTDPVQSTIPLTNLATELSKRDDSRAEASAIFEQAIEILQDSLKPEDPRLAVIISNMAWIPLKQGDFSLAAKLNRYAVDVAAAGHGTGSAEYAVALNNLGTTYGQWARATGDPACCEKERAFVTEATDITRKTRGPRHPEMSARFNNLAYMYETTGDIRSAAEQMKNALAVDLSLNQLEHADTKRHVKDLIRLLAGIGQIGAAQRVLSGDLSEFRPTVEQIEAEHRAWVAEDPENRHFGPPSPVTGATE